MSEVIEALMRRAISVARRAQGDMHPNPAVGALIIENGEVVAEGYHPRAGELHAERQALKALGRLPKPGSSMVVTLEPCSTHGRTPPCVDAVVEAGIQTLYVGALDPNPAHAGRGIDILRERGVQVFTGCLDRECTGINPIFNYRILHPDETLFAVKIATTLDGKIATRSGESQWITGEKARADVMRWRRYFPAMLVGVGTVLADDPSLTVRMEGEANAVTQRFVLDVGGRLREAESAKVLADAFAASTTVLTSEEPAGESGYLSDFRERGGQVLAIGLDDDGRADFKTLKRQFSEMGIDGVMIEPGQGLMRSLVQQRSVDYVIQYIAPKIMADLEAKSAWDGHAPEAMTEVLKIADPLVDRFGDDLRLRGAVVFDA